MLTQCQLPTLDYYNPFSTVTPSSRLLYLVLVSKRSQNQNKTNLTSPVLSILSCSAPLSELALIHVFRFCSQLLSPHHPLDAPRSSYRLSCSPALCILFLSAFKTTLGITPLGTLSCNQNSLPPLCSLFIYLFASNVAPITVHCYIIACVYPT